MSRKTARRKANPRDSRFTSRRRYSFPVTTYQATEEDLARFAVKATGQEAPACIPGGGGR